ncbi:MAG: hypothetical protein IKX81_01440, partial [Firmicutes bacterium]|nr:hypothetical protein [Bacillota bacterium]
AYSFLLTQAGVDATIMMGGDHAWSYVRINGNNYHIDPTFVLGEPVNMAYFMMTDGQRRYTYSDDGDWTIASVFVHEHEHPEYEEFVAEDDFFKDIWDTTLVDFDHDKHVMYCTSIFDGEGDIDFDYEGF